MIVDQHPEIIAKLDKWERMKILLDDNEEEISTQDFCFKMVNEKSNAYKSRLQHFVYDFINPTTDLVHAPVRSVCQRQVKEEYREGSAVEKFMQNVTNTKIPVDMKDFARDFIGPGLRSFGNNFLVLDKSRELFDNRKDEQELGLPYLSMISPSDVVNWEIKNGEFIWFAYKLPDFRLPWTDPLNPPDSLTDLVFVWTLTDYTVYQGDKVVNDLSGSNPFGFVPVVTQATYLQNPSYLIGDCSMNMSTRWIITMNNLLSTGVHDIYKHGASILLWPEGSVISANQEVDEEGNPVTKRQDAGGKIEYAGEKPPEYALKDMQVDHNMKWAEFYNQKIIENERDQSSVSKKGDKGQAIAESGFAKLIEKDPVTGNLVSLALSMESCIQKVIFMVATIMGENPDDSTYEYDKNFDLRTEKQIYEELKLAIDNGIEQVSITATRLKWKDIVKDYSDNEDTEQLMKDEIDVYEGDPFKEEESNEFNINKNSSMEK